MVSGAGARPILLPDEPGISTTLALGTAEQRQGPRADQRDRTRRRDRDARRSRWAPRPPGSSTWPIRTTPAATGQNREPGLSARAVATVKDLWYSMGAAPEREVAVTLSNPYTSREQTTRTITEVLVNAAIVALVVALIVALLLAQWLVRPLRRLTQTSRLLAEGHLEARVAIPSNSPPEVAGAGRGLQRDGRAARGVGDHHQPGPRPQPGLRGRRQPRAAHAHRGPAHLQRAAPGGRRRASPTPARSSCVAAASRSSASTGWPPTSWSSPSSIPGSWRWTCATRTCAPWRRMPWSTPCPWPSARASACVCRCRRSPSSSRTTRRASARCWATSSATPSSSRPRAGT